MSGFEDYARELTELDHEIRHYAAICEIDLEKPYQLEANLTQRFDNAANTRSRQTLQGLLVLRIKVETEMLELGFSPPPLIPPAATEPT